MSASDSVTANRSGSSTARRRRSQPMPWLKPGILIGGLVPLFSILWQLRTGGLGANPIAEIENQLGLTALIFLVTALACTPAKHLFGWNWQMRVRRMIGLFAFFYGCVHFLTYLVVDQRFDWEVILEDIAERPFITVGFATLVLLVPLAITSTNGWVRRLGYYKWLRIHQLIYLAVPLAILHFIWRVKVDVSQPMTYGVIVASLLAVRVVVWWLQRSKKQPAAG